MARGSSISSERLSPNAVLYGRLAPAAQLDHRTFTGEQLRLLKNIAQLGGSASYAMIHDAVRELGIRNLSSYRNVRKLLDELEQDGLVKENGSILYLSSAGKDALKNIKI